MSTINESLIKARELLKNKNIPLFDAYLMLENIFSMPKENILADLNKEFPPQSRKRFFKMVKKRAKKIPLAYVLGYQEFMSLKFYVEKGIFIPREETELLVKEALNIFSEDNEAIIFEIGTGCGNIAISLALKLPKAKIMAIDISKKALKVAKKNAKIFRVENIEFMHGSLFSPLWSLNLKGKIDLIISNPPYVSERDWRDLDEEIRKYENKRSLVPGETGLEIIEEIIKKSPEFLKSEGFLMLEIGYDQKEKVKKLFDKNWKRVEFFNDFNGIARVVKAQLI